MLLVASLLLASIQRPPSIRGQYIPQRTLRMVAPAPIRYAVLVDAENTQYSRMEPIMEELAKYGATSIRLVYGDFTKQSLFPWRSVALDLSFRSVNAFSFTAKKGSSDAAMIIDAMDM
jgi:DUF971 family protein